MNGTEHLINLYLLAEALQKRGIHCTLLPGGAMAGLRGMKFYEADQKKQEAFLLICQDPQKGPLPSRGNLLLLGNWPETEISQDAGYLLIPEPPDLAVLFNLLTDLFVQFENIEEKLRQCLQQRGSLKKICDLWLELFDTDIFVHDQYFRILACPRHIAGLPPFEYNEQIGYYMQDSNTLTRFLSSSAYQRTLTTRGGCIWKSDFNDTSSMYANIWFDSSYQGRLIVLDAQPTPGKLRMVEYFGEAVCDAMRNLSLSRSDGPEPLHSVMMEAIHGEDIDQEELKEKIRWMGWELQQRYVCAVITFGQEDLSRYIVMGICNTLQKLLKGCYTCVYQDSVYLLVNLTVSGVTMEEIPAKIAQLECEAFAHMGVSQEFYDLTLLTDFLNQAKFEEQYTREHRFSGWYNAFQDHALVYWLGQKAQQMKQPCLESYVLPCLRAYDEKNGTELYRTLEVFLMAERNATLTSQQLQIHRSTLPHRLNRIQELTGVNLDSFQTRLYLLMSFALEKLESAAEQQWSDL